MKKFLAIVVLLISNAVPLVGVLFWGWKVFPILLTYWFENVAIGFWNVFKMRKCSMVGQKPDNFDITFMNNPVDDSSRYALIFFFIVHYGIFTLVHGVLLISFFGFFGSEGINIFQIIIAFISILVSHAMSYYLNFVGKNEYLTTTVNQQMFKPYSRVIIMHLVIIFGSFFVTSSGSSIFALLLLVCLKTLIDLTTHIFEHKDNYGFSLKII